MSMLRRPITMIELAQEDIQEMVQLVEKRQKATAKEQPTSQVTETSAEPMDESEPSFFQACLTPPPANQERLTTPTPGEPPAIAPNMRVTRSRAARGGVSTSSSPAGRGNQQRPRAATDTTSALSTPLGQLPAFHLNFSDS